MSPLTLAALFAVAIALLVVGFLGVTTYNDVVALRNRAARAWANIDVALKQRHDQLPAYVEAVRGVMQFERDVLTEVAERRAAYSDRETIPRQAATSDATSAAVRRLFAVVERYPDIKSAANVASLQGEIARLEDLIADRRELYNDQVFRYNTRIAQVPASVLTGLFAWQSLPFFAAEGNDRERPTVDLRVAGPGTGDRTDL